MFGETRKQPQGLADLLLWFGLVDDGIVLQRDGSLLAAWQYRGPDLQSATHAEMAAIARRLNRIISSWQQLDDSGRLVPNRFQRLLAGGGISRSSNSSD